MLQTAAYVHAYEEMALGNIYAENLRQSIAQKK
jgi:hypothetical protein